MWVLVHCVNGRHRSTQTVSAMLMPFFGNAEEVMSYVWHRRSLVQFSKLPGHISIDIWLNELGHMMKIMTRKAGSFSLIQTGPSIMGTRPVEGNVGRRPLGSHRWAKASVRTFGAVLFLRSSRREAPRSRGKQNKRFFPQAQVRQSHFFQGGANRWDHHVRA